MFVEFETRSIQSEALTAEAGHPMFEDVEYITILIDERSKVERPVSEKDKIEYAPLYTAFVQDLAPPVEGMPLKEWALITRAQCDSLAHFAVKTVEDLAHCPTTTLQRFGPGGLDLQKKANAWLESAGTDGKNASDIAELTAENENLKEKIEDLTAQVNALFAQSGETAPRNPTKTKKGKATEKAQ